LHMSEILLVLPILVLLGTGWLAASLAGAGRARTLGALILGVLGLALLLYAAAQGWFPSGPVDDADPFAGLGLAFTLFYLALPAFVGMISGGALYMFRGRA